MVNNLHHIRIINGNKGYNLPNLSKVRCHEESLAYLFTRICQYAIVQTKQGYSFDLDSPRTFTEKIQWQKTRFKRQDIVRYVDKFLFKQLIKEKLGDGFTIPMYGAWTNVNDFRNAWDSLPEKFCLKSTLQSDGKYIKVIEKSQTDLEELCNEVKEWLRPKNPVSYTHLTLPTIA